MDQAGARRRCQGRDAESSHQRRRRPRHRQLSLYPQVEIMRKTIWLLLLIRLSVAHGADATTRPTRILVTNERSGDVTVIDAATNAIVATIPVGTRPRGIRISPDGKLAFVAVSATPISGPG